MTAAKIRFGISGASSFIAFISILTISLFLLTEAQADWDFGAKYANEFLTLGSDARASAMGETGVAFGRGVSAGYWNPATLTQIPGGGVMGMHADRFSGIVKYEKRGRDRKQVSVNLPTS